MKDVIKKRELDGEIKEHNKTPITNIDQETYEYEEYGKCYFCSYQHHCKSKCDEDFYYTTEEAWD